MKIQTGNHNAGSEAGNPLVRSANLKWRSKSGSAQICRLEIAWAWASLLVLIVCWDAALRLDQRVSVPRVRMVHAGETGTISPERKIDATVNPRRNGGRDSPARHL